MRQTRLQIAKQDIINLLDSFPTKVLKRSDLQKALAENREFWRLATSTTFSQFVDFLAKSAKLKRTRLEFPKRAETLYLWGDVPPYSVALALRPGTYLSHYTAIALHQLTEQIPSMIYVNSELPPGSQARTPLLQERINAAFQRSPRQTTCVAAYGDYSVCLIYSKNTGKLGVANMAVPGEGELPVTDLERTLIDIAVRPFYAGGVFEVMKAYQMAAERVSVNRIVALLKKMDFVYPYHQAIGFYLERAGRHSQRQIQLLREIPMQFDFYLTYGMPEAEYSKPWRLFFPKGL